MAKGLLSSLKDSIPTVGKTGASANGSQEDDFKEERTLEQDKALITWAERTYDKLKQERIPLERQWYVNMAFNFGRQNIAVVRSNATTTGFQLVTPKAPPWRVRMIVNHVRRIIRTETAKLSAQKPRPFVVPNTTEDKDLASARVAEQIIEAKFSMPETSKLLRSWIWWGAVCGTSFLKMYYDKGKEDENGTKGAICIDRLNPFELLVPDLVEEELEKQAFVIHATTKDVEQVKQTYGVEVEPNATGMSDMIEDQFLNLIGAQQMKKDRVIVLEFWLKPGAHKQFPNGGMFTTAGGKLLHVDQGKIPYQHKEFPFYKFTSLATGRFYGDSIIVDLIPLQREINRTRSQIVESKNLMSKPKLMAYKGSVNPKLITSEPGQVIGVVPGFEMPRPLETPPIPQYVLELEQRLHQDMDDLSGQHEISRGQNPTQVTAATALSFLQEQDDTKLAYAVASIEDAISKLGRHYLKLVTQYWNTERLVKVVGREGMFEVQQFKGSDLNNNTDVRVEAGSALPQSRAAKAAYVMELFKFGAFEPERLLEMLDLQGAEKIYEESLIDKREAQRENMLMAKMTEQEVTQIRQLQQMMEQEGIADPEQFTPLVKVEEWNNHELHILYHNQFRKTQQFSLLPDAVKQEFALHVHMHRQALQEGMAPQQEQEQAELEAENPEIAPEPNPEQQEFEAQQIQQNATPESPGQLPGQGII